MVGEGKSKEKLQEKAQELSEDDRELVQQLSTDMENKKSKLYKCIANADEEVKEYRTKDQDAYMEKLVDEMYERNDCQLAAHVFKAGVKAKKKGGEEDEDEDTDEEKEDEEN